MTIRNPHIKKLSEKYQEISLIGKSLAVLDWDLNVNLPPKAAAGRAAQISFLTQILTEHWLDPEIASLIAEAVKVSDKLNQEEKAILRNIQREAKYFFKVPKELIIKKSKVTTEAFMAWQKARRENKFSDFLPFLKEITSLNQMIAEYLGYKDNPYDALLNLYEPGLTAAFCEETFGKLQVFLTDFIEQIKSSPKYKADNPLFATDKNYPIKDQEQLALFVIRKMGFDFEAGRLDTSPHPFTTTLDRFDVRITTRYKNSDFRDSLTAAVHETGHGLYEQGINPEYAGTPLEGACSLAFHESQSRFWENQIGRNPEFLKFMFPIFQAFYPEQFSKINSDDLIMALNQVKPGFIRVDADEVTYNLHIILRFELENALMNKRIKPEDLPEIWQTKMKKYLGVVPQTDREGVLQDVHWSYGDFGYFPTYSLGNLYSAQISAALKKELDFNFLLQKGEFGEVLSYLRDNIHRFGSLYLPGELIKKVSGQALNPEYFMDYIKQKYSNIYELNLDSNIKVTAEVRE